MEELAQKSYICPMLGSATDKAGWNPDQHDLVKGGPAHRRGFETKQSLRTLPTQIILCSYSKIQESSAGVVLIHTGQNGSKITKIVSKTIYSHEGFILVYSYYIKMQLSLQEKEFFCKFKFKRTYLSLD